MSLCDLQNKVIEKLNVLSVCLDTLKDQQKALQDNTDKVKTGISTSADAKVYSLRQRERQLIHQVEVVTAHQKSLLDTQIAKLMRIKGSLTATHEILQYSNPDVEALAKIYEGSVSSLKAIPSLKLISVQIDENPLSLAIGNYGKVVLPDILAHHHSSVIPDKMEEYGDSEQEVLHKSICSASSTIVENPTICVQFPKIPANGWLYASSPKPKGSSTTSVLERNSINKSKIRSISSWMADLTVSHEDSKNGSSFDLVEDYFDNPQNFDKNRRSSLCSSIEIVPSVDSEKDSCAPGSISYSRTSCGNIGIAKHKAVSRSQNSSICIEEFACQANEPCESYDDCLCSGYCKDLANERALQTSRWLMKSQQTDNSDAVAYEDGQDEKQDLPCLTGVKRKLSPTEGRDEVLKHMSSILSSDPSKWLVRKPNGKVLKVSSQPDSKGTGIIYTPPTNSWLCKVPVEAPAETLISPVVKFSPHSNIWLLHKIKEEKRVQNEQIWLNNSTASEEEKNGSLSINDLRGALAELAVPKNSLNATTKPFSLSALPIDTISNNSINNIYLHYNTGKVDIQPKLKWLAKFQSLSLTPNADSCLNIISKSQQCLPESLVALAESNLDKWLINRS